MLAIRFLRSGRANKAFFRIVLTESSKPPKSGFLKILGWYDPQTKKTSLEKEEILKWLDKGARASNSVAKLLSANAIKHKLAKYVPDKEKMKKSKGEEKPKTPKAPDKEADNTEETKENEEAEAPETKPAEADATKEETEEAVNTEKPAEDEKIKVEEKIKEEK